MKEKPKPIETKFARERRFTIKPSPAATSRRRKAEQLETLQQALLTAIVGRSEDPTHLDVLQRASTEAAALAWLTPCPALFFPGLFEEKVVAAQRYVDRQRRIQRGVRPAIDQAA